MKVTFRSAPLISRARQASRTRNASQDAHVWGEQETGYKVGLSPGRRWKPQNSSGSRCSSKKMLASKRPARIFAASRFGSRDSSTSRRIAPTRPQRPVLSTCQTTQAMLRLTLARGLTDPPTDHTDLVVYRSMRRPTYFRASKCCSTWRRPAFPRRRASAGSLSSRPTRSAIASTSPRATI